MKHYFFFLGRTGQNTMNRERIIYVYCPVPEDFEILQLCSNLSSLLLLCKNTEKYKPERFGGSCLFGFFFFFPDAWGYIDLDYPQKDGYLLGFTYFSCPWGIFLDPLFAEHNITCTFEVLLSLFQYT